MGCRGNGKERTFGVDLGVDLGVQVGKYRALRWEKRGLTLQPIIGEE